MRLLRTGATPGPRPTPTGGARVIPIEEIKRHRLVELAGEDPRPRVASVLPLPASSPQTTGPGVRGFLEAVARLLAAVSWLMVAGVGVVAMAALMAPVFFLRLLSALWPLWVVLAVLVLF